MKYCGIIFAIPSQRHILETDDVISKYADDLQKFSKLDVVVFSSVDFLVVLLSFIFLGIVHSEIRENKK